MEGRAHRKALAIVALTLIVSARPAAADSRRAHAAVDGDDVVLLFTHSSDGTVGARARSGHSSCQWHSEPWASATPHVPNLPTEVTGPQPTPEHQLYVVTCGNYTGTRWVGPRDFVDPMVDALIEQARREVGLLPAAVEVRPGNRGVTGVPSLFWVNGYDGTTVDRQESAFGLTVTVRFQLTDVTWDFGDGSPQEHGGLGEAWPKRSSVRHNYRFVSGEQPYLVRVTLTFQPTADGADAGTLEPVQVTFTRPYAVGQVQAVGRS